jgi:hypothetical protein
LVKEGKLRKLNHGLFLHPRSGRFGEVPAEDYELVRGFLQEDEFVFTGSEQWNALGLGSTAVRAVPLVYNRKRTGDFRFGNRRFELRRVDFPESPPPEWFVVDLLQHTDQAGVSHSDVTENLCHALSSQRFDSSVLQEMAEDYGTRATQELVATAVMGASKENPA